MRQSVKKKTCEVDHKVRKLPVLQAGSNLNYPVAIWDEHRRRTFLSAGYCWHQSQTVTVCMFLLLISRFSLFHQFIQDLSFVFYHTIYIYVYIIRLSDYQTICVVKSLNPIDFSIYPLVISYVAIEAMAHFEIVDWPMNSMVIVHSFVVCLPEGKSHEKSREKSHLTSINSHGKSHFWGV